MTEPLLPVDPDEPKPWTVSIWRYHTERREPFVTREDAIAYAKGMDELDSDDFAVGDIHRPDGSVDLEATKEATPWAHRTWK